MKKDEDKVTKKKAREMMYGEEKQGERREV